jgi:hypothetical protein
MPIIKDGKNISAIYKGNTPIKKVYHGSTLVWQGKPSYKFEIVGTLTDNNGIYSGFSDSNYIVTPEITEQNVTSFEQVIAFRTVGTTPTTQYLLGGNSMDYGCNMFVMASRSRLMVKTQGVDGTGTNSRYDGVSLNTWYCVKLSIDNGVWTTYVSDDMGNTWTQFADVKELGIPNNLNQRLRIGKHFIDGYSFSGEVDMSRSYIKVNGVNLW